MVTNPGFGRSRLRVQARASRSVADRAPGRGPLPRTGKRGKVSPARAIRSPLAAPAQGLMTPLIEVFRHINAFSSILMTRSVTKSFPFPTQHSERCQGLFHRPMRAWARSGLSSAHGVLRLSASLCSTFPPSLPGVASEGLHLSRPHASIVAGFQLGFSFLSSRPETGTGSSPLLRCAPSASSLPEGSPWAVSLPGGSGCALCPGLTDPHPPMSAGMPRPFRGHPDRPHPESGAPSPLPGLVCPSPQGADSELELHTACVLMAWRSLREVCLSSLQEATAGPPSVGPPSPCCWTV